MWELETVISSLVALHHPHHWGQLSPVPPPLPGLSHGESRDHTALPTAHMVLCTLGLKHTCPEFVKGRVSRHPGGESRMCSGDRCKQ